MQDCNGKAVTINDRVFTNDQEYGTIITIGADGWADVKLDSGKTRSYNRERIRKVAR